MTTFGAATNLVAGTITLTLPAGAKYWYIQNQDIGVLKITFTGGDGTFGPVVLNAAAAIGAAGDWMDSMGFGWFGTSVTLTSTVATAQFGSGWSRKRPTNTVT